MLTEDARALLSQYPWPGNVRELRNVTESVSVLERGNVVDSHILKKYLHETSAPDFDRMLPVPIGKSTEQAERELIFRALVEIRSDLMEIKSTLERRLAPPLQLPPARDEGATMVSLEDYSLEEMEKLMITNALNRFEGNRRLAAKALKISERTLYRKIREFGLS
jgi:DNA-binding NtrC family response regulator